MRKYCTCRLRSKAQQLRLQQLLGMAVTHSSEKHHTWENWTQQCGPLLRMRAPCACARGLRQPISPVASMRHVVNTPRTTQTQGSP